MYKLFENCIIHSMDNSVPISTAMLVLNDRIVFCGNKEEINLPQYALSKIDLNGMHVYPGFIDCHTHVAWTALDKEKVRLDNIKSLATSLILIKEHSKGLRSGEWITGGGWNSNIWSDGQPHKSHLDNLSNNHPIALYNKDMHTQWLNSEALSICGFNRESSNPPGGRLGRDQNGELTGLVYEKACDLVNKSSISIDYDCLQRGMDKIYPELYALGITSLHSCERHEIWSYFQQMAQKNRLGVRVCMHPPLRLWKSMVTPGRFKILYGWISGFSNRRNV
jgi:predicted amidohydrolase YtcJ